MTTSYSRVTVAHGTRTVDLAMPSALPLADIMPQLLDLCLPDASGEQPQVWVLGRPGEQSLGLDRSLGEAGIRDGDVLELHRRTDSPLPAYVEDVRDAVEDAVDGSSRQWGATTTLGFVVASGSAALAAVTLLPEVRQPRDTIALTAAAVTATALVPAVWWLSQRIPSGLVQSVVAVACLWGGLTGWLAASSPSDGPLQWLAAAAGVLVVAATMRSVTSLAAPHLAAATVLVVAAATGVLPARTDPYDAARAVAVVAVLAVGALPRASLTVGGLAAADYRVRNALLLTQEALVNRIRQSSWLPTGALAALAALGGVAGIGLAYQPRVWDGLLALTVGLGLLLRSRLFSRIPHVLPLRLAGVAVAAALALRHGTRMEVLAPWFAVVTLLVAVVVAAISATPLSDITHARVKQLLNWIEYVVVIAMVALAAAAFGVYDLVLLRTG